MYLQNQSTWAGQLYGLGCCPFAFAAWLKMSSITEQPNANRVGTVMAIWRLSKQSLVAQWLWLSQASAVE